MEDVNSSSCAGCLSLSSGISQPTPSRLCNEVGVAVVDLV